MSYDVRFIEKASGLTFTLTEQKGKKEICYFFTSDDGKMNSQHFISRDNAVKAMEQRYLGFSDNEDLCRRCNHA